MRREWQIQLAVCLLLVLACSILLFFGYYLTTVFFLIIALILAWRTIPRQHRAYIKFRKTLAEKGDKIVWVYAMITEQSPFGINLTKTCTLYLKMIDREQFSVNIPVQKLDLVQDNLGNLLPHATIGYSKDREQWYLADPALLRKGNKV